MSMHAAFYWLPNCSLLLLALSSLKIIAVFANQQVIKQCGNLKIGQYRCNFPNVDTITERAVCIEESHQKFKTEEFCETIPGLLCFNGTSNSSFFSRKVDCQHTNGKDFRTALLLSIFLGWLGADRFYLGYPALGFFKLCTFGFFFIFHLVDVLLIALQVVLPADGSAYVIDYFGPKMEHIVFNNQTSFG